MRDAAARHRQHHPARARARRHRQRHRPRHRAARRARRALRRPGGGARLRRHPRRRPAADRGRRHRHHRERPARRCAPASRPPASPPPPTARSRSARASSRSTSNLQSFPLALVDRAAGNRGLRGTISGTGRATGPLADPSGAASTCAAKGITADVLAANQVPPFALTASGSYRGGALELAAARATAPGGLDLQGSGRIPFAGPGLDASVSGSLPLGLANPLLAEPRGRRPRARCASPPPPAARWRRRSSPAPSSLSGGSIFDPATNIRLQNIALDAALDGNAARAPQLPRRGGRRRHHHRPGPGRLRLRLPRRPHRAAARRALHRRRLRRHAALGRPHPRGAAGRRRGHARRAASTSAAPRSRWPRGSAPTPRARSTR